MELVFSSRFSILAAPLVLLALAHPALYADDADDPVRYNKKLSEWLAILQNREAPLKQRRAAVLVVGSYEPQQPGVIEGLGSALQGDPDQQIRRGAAQTLGAAAQKAREALAKSPDDDEEKVRLLKRGVERAVDALAEALAADKSEEVRAMAATGLGRIGPPAKRVAAALRQALKDKHAGARAAAADALGRVDAEADEVVPLLAEALADSDRAVRLSLLAALLRFGDKGRAAVPRLAERLVQDKEPEVRSKSAETLGQMGEEARAAAPQLLQALADPHVDVRRWAAIALAKIHPEAQTALPVLAKVLKSDTDPFVRSHAVHALAALGKEAVPPLIDCVRTEKAVDVLLAAIEALGVIGPDAAAAAEALLAARKDARAPVREAADTALKKIQGTP